MRISLGGPSSLVMCAAMLALLSLGSIARAQEPEPSPPILLNVDFEAAPTEDVSELSRLADLTPGAVYSAAAIRRAAKVLFQLGRFENVYVYADRQGDQVSLRFELPPKPRMLALNIVDSAVLSRSDIVEALDYRDGAPINQSELPAKRQAIRFRLSDRGYRQSAVGIALEQADDSGGRNFIVRIDPGPVTLMRKLIVTGTPELSQYLIQQRIGMDKGDVLDMTAVSGGIERLRSEYRKRGYYDVSISAPVVRELVGSGTAPRADLAIVVTAGPQVRVRFSGNREVSVRELKGAVEVVREQGTSEGAIAEARERVQTRYEIRGYWKAEVKSKIRTSPDQKLRDVVFAIEEGAPARVANLTFPGNDVMKDEALRETVFEIVGQTMRDDLGRPGADPQVVGRIFGDLSNPGTRDSPQPTTAAPDPEVVYIERAYRASINALADLFQARGYQTVKIDNPVPRLRAPGSELIDVEIPITPGVRWTIGAVAFSGNEEIPAAELLQFAETVFEQELGVLPPLSFRWMIEARRSIAAHYRSKGYLFAKVTEELRQVPERGSLGQSAFVKTSTEAPLDVRAICGEASARGEETCAVEVVFRIHEGPLVHTREVIVRGINRTRPGIVQDEITVADGNILSEPDMVETRDNLLRVGVFDRVSVKPMDEELIAAEKDVVVELSERKSYFFELGGGASTEEGVRVFTGFGDSNVGGTALRLQMNAKLNYQITQFLFLYDQVLRDNIESFYSQFSTAERFEYELAAGVSYPRFIGLPRGFSAGLDVIVLRDYDPAFAENTQVLTLIGNYKGYRPLILGKPRPLAFQLRVNLERSDLQCNRQITGREFLCTRNTETGSSRIEGTTFYTSIGPRISFDLRDSPIDPRLGIYAELEAGFSKGLDSNSPDFTEISARLNGFIPLFYHRLVLAMSGHFEKIFPLDSQITPLDIPVNRRLFADSRIRGFPLKTLLPQDVQTGITGELNPISTGGLLFASISTELRFLILDAVWLASFVDVGDLFESGTFSLESPFGEGTRTLAIGAGFGVRVVTPIGLMAVDLAIPVNSRDPGAEGFTLHFAVGTF